MLALRSRFGGRERGDGGGGGGRVGRRGTVGRHRFLRDDGGRAGRSRRRRSDVARRTSLERRVAREERRRPATATAAVGLGNVNTRGRGVGQTPRRGERRRAPCFQTRFFYFLPPSRAVRVIGAGTSWFRTRDRPGRPAGRWVEKTRNDGNPRPTA